MTTSLQSIANIQIEKWTGLPEQTVGKMKEYKLWVRFGGSSEQLLLCQGTHEECLHASGIFYRFIIQESSVHHKQFLFIRNVVTPDRIIIGYMRSNAPMYAKPGLWATFTIEEE